MVVLRCKVLLVGDVEVGKTACLQMFHSNGKTFPKNYLSTNGVELTVKVVNIPDSETAVEMYVHDCSGSDLHRSLMPAVWTGAAAVIVAYDMTNADSFRNCAKWVDMLMESFGQRKIKGVLLGCKGDVRDAIAVPNHVAHEFAMEHGLQHFECSAFEGKEVDTPFNFIADMFSRSYETKCKRLQS